MLPPCPPVVNYSRPSALAAAWKRHPQLTQTAAGDEVTRLRVGQKLFLDTLQSFVAEQANRHTREDRKLDEDHKSTIRE